MLRLKRLYAGRYTVEYNGVKFNITNLSVNPDPRFSQWVVCEDNNNLEFSEPVKTMAQAKQVIENWNMTRQPKPKFAL